MTKEQTALKTAWFAAAALLLAGCGPGDKADDAYAGLDRAIRDWRVALIASEPACQGKTAQGNEPCQAFEVSCKVEDPITPAERASGVTQRVLAAITWTAPDPAGGGGRPDSATAVFTRTADGWTRKPVTDPVNVRTCARG